MTKKTATTASLQGLGPKSAAALAAIGIRTAAQLKARDPYAIYARLKRADPSVSLNMLYALIGAIDDVHWLAVKRERRTEILLRLDELGLAPK